VEDIRAQLLAAFQVEHRDHVDAIRRALATPAKADLREVFRRAHSLKGAARAVDKPDVEALAHELEDVFAAAMEGRSALAGPVLHQIENLLQAIEAGAGETSGEPDPEAPSPGPRLDLVRISADAVDALTRAVRELSSAAQAQAGLPDRLVRLTDEARRLHAHSRDQGRSDELEHGLAALAASLLSLSQRQARQGWALDQAASTLRTEVEAVALAPAETVIGDLARMVRGLASEAGLDVEVHVEGLQTRAERRVMQALRDPLIHLLRNALSHGAQSAEERRAANKPERMTVRLELSNQGGRLLAVVSDDGRGPDVARIAQAARERGVIPGDAETPASAEEILGLAFEPGVSAAAEVDQLAGRGMGLSIVAEAVRALGGSVTLAARRPHGAEVRLSAPISTARQALVLVEAGGDAFAVPAFAVRRTLRLAHADLERVEDAAVARIEIDGSVVTLPMVPLDTLLGRPARAAAGAHLRALVLARGERWLGLVVDEIHDVADLVVEAVSPAGLDVSLVSGAVRTEHDVPAPVLNSDALFDQWLRIARRQASAGVGLAAPDVAAAPRTILVVDDSITTRTLEKSILESQGFRVLLAVDGVDALQVLRSDALVDLVIADVEMPRMDGFSLLQAIKADGALASLPAILMTSRDDPEDIRRGMDLGADAYITKQKFDQRELLAAIGRLL
jgi:two-component system chemotaxis sensor kinase CheA